MNDTTGKVRGTLVAIAAGACLAFGCGASASTTHDAGPQGDGLPDANVGQQTDASARDASVVDAAAIDSGPSLPNVASTRVQLWLTADVGVECANGEILTWADQSGKHRDAVHGAHKGPQCPPTLHALAGVNLPYFSAPGTVAPFNDETLDVDLGFLAGTEYTIFVVERRWADRTPASGKNEELIGTDLPNQSITACPASGYQINLGYVYYDGFPALNYESVCYTPWSGTRGQVPPAGLPPSPAVLDMLRLWQDAGASPTVWQNGVKINAGGASGGPGSGFVGGSIGRALGYTTGDNRFQGDIAEVVVFDVALTDSDVPTLEAYFKQHWQLP